MFDAPLFFDGIGGILRTVFAAAILYGAVVLAVRIFGKRSTSQMNNFDWIVTVAIGSLMASGMLLSNVTVFESAASVYTLLSLQWILTKIMTKSDNVANIVKSEPTLLVHNGQILWESLKNERITEAEIYGAIRQAGYSRLADVQWVILETNSNFSIIDRKQPSDSQDMLKHIGAVGNRSLGDIIAAGSKIS